MLSIVAMGFEIAWNMNMELNNNDNNKMPSYLLVLSVCCLSIQLVVYTMLIYWQWSMFIYYILKKK